LSTFNTCASLKWMPMCRFSHIASKQSIRRGCWINRVSPTSNSRVGRRLPFCPSIISLTHILWFSPPSMHSLLQWKKRRRCRHQRPNQIILHSVWLRSPCPRREGRPAVIRAGQETYSNGEMNQAISESVIHGDRRARKQEEKTRSEIGTGRRKQTRLGIKQDKKIGFEDKNTMILMMANQSKGKKELWCPCWG
jgi:hypothetical protein